jgi:CRP-like cAMP-binding protein
MTQGQTFDYRAFIAKHGGGVAKFDDRKIIYTQDDPSDALFYIADGSVKVTFVSEFGKEAVTTILGPGDFFGEGCMDGHLLRNSTLTTTNPAKSHGLIGQSSAAPLPPTRRLPSC